MHLLSLRLYRPVFSEKLFRLLCLIYLISQVISKLLWELITYSWQIIRGYIEAISEIEQQIQSNCGVPQFDDIVVACGRCVSHLVTDYNATLLGKFLIVSAFWMLCLVFSCSFSFHGPDSIIHDSGRHTSKMMTCNWHQQPYFEVCLACTGSQYTFCSWSCFYAFNVLYSSLFSVVLFVHNDLAFQAQLKVLCILIDIAYRLS